MKTEKRIFNIMHKESKITNTSLLTKSSMFMLLGAYQCAVKRKQKGSLGILQCFQEALFKMYIHKDPLITL